MNFGGSINLCDGDHWNVGASVDVSEGHEITAQASHACNDDIMLFGTYNIAFPRSDHSTLALGASIKHSGWTTNMMASAKLPYAAKEEGSNEEKLH